METGDVQLREMVKLTESKIMNQLKVSDSSSVNAALIDMNDDDKERFEVITELLICRKKLLDKMFRGTEEEYKRLRSVNNLLRDKTFEIDEISSDTYKYWVDNNEGWLKDAEITVGLFLPMEHTDIDVRDEVKEFYGSDFEIMINIESVVGMLTMQHLEESVNSMTFNIKASDFDSTIDDWKMTHLQWLDKKKSGKWCHATHYLEDIMNFPIIDIIHLKDLKIKLEINVSCKTKV